MPLTKKLTDLYMPVEMMEPTMIWRQRNTTNSRQIFTTYLKQVFYDG